VKFHETPIPGAYLIELEPNRDERGSYSRLFDSEIFAERGLEATIVQANVVQNPRAGTLRGLHWQEAPYEESKLMRCSRGAIFDVVVDIRPDSEAYCQWYGAELSPENERMMYLPPGVAHGLQTLVDDTEVIYQVGHRYVPESGRGARWDDPAFGIEWPEAAERIINERDRTYPDFKPSPGG